MLQDIIADPDFRGLLTAAAIFAVLLILAGVVNILFRLLLRYWERRDPTGLRIRVIRILKGPIVLLIGSAGLFMGLLTLARIESSRFGFIDGIEGLEAGIGNAWTAAVIAQVTYAIYRMLNMMLTWYITQVAAKTETKLDDRLLPPIRRILPLIVYSLGTLAILTSLGIPISPIWAGLGISGIAVALAVQPTLANFFAGTYVVTEGELNIGDYIELEGGPAGYVVEVGWRSTKVRNFHNNLVIIPNSKMAESIVTNYYSPTPAMNVLVYCGVSYDSDLQHVEDVVRDLSQKLVNESQFAIKEVEPFIGFEEFGNSNITFWVFIQATDRTGSFILTSELVKAIHRRLVDEGIEINYLMRKLVLPPPNGVESAISQAARTARPEGDSDGGT